MGVATYDKFEIDSDNALLCIYNADMTDFEQTIDVNYFYHGVDNDVLDFMDNLRYVKGNEGEHDDLMKKSMDGNYIQMIASLCDLVSDPPSVFRENNDPLTSRDLTEEEKGKWEMVTKKTDELKAELEMVGINVENFDFSSQLNVFTLANTKGATGGKSYVESEQKRQSEYLSNARRSRDCL